MMDDLISREAVKEMMKNHRVDFSTEKDYRTASACVNAVPPAKPLWIPCSERLPEVKQKVLVQYADGSMATKRCNDAGHLQWFYANAVAWKPAPEPYQKGDAE